MKIKTTTAPPFPQLNPDTLIPCHGHHIWIIMKVGLVTTCSEDTLSILILWCVSVNYVRFRPSCYYACHRMMTLFRVGDNDVTWWVTNDRVVCCRRRRREVGIDSVRRRGVDAGVCGPLGGRGELTNAYDVITIHSRDNLKYYGAPNNCSQNHRCS